MIERCFEISEVESVNAGTPDFLEFLAQVGG
jgi:hypothetical protein